MSVPCDVLYLFLLGSLFGWFFENTCFNKHACDSNLQWLTGACLPLLLMYGLAFVSLYLLQEYLGSRIGIVCLALLAAAILTAIECIGGKLSKLCHGRQTWSYADWPLPFCDNYACVPVSIGWFLAALVFFALVR